MYSPCHVRPGLEQRNRVVFIADYSAFCALIGIRIEEKNTSLNFCVAAIRKQSLGPKVLLHAINHAGFPRASSGSVCEIEVAGPFESPTRLFHPHPHPPVLPAVRWRTVAANDYERRSGTASKRAQGQGTEACADGYRLLGGCSDEARRGERGGEGSQSSRCVSDFAGDGSLDAPGVR